MRGIRRRPSPALVVSVAALVAALAGTAVAADLTATTAAKKVTKKKAKRIANRQIDKRLPIGPQGIARSAVTRAKIVAGAVSTDKLIDGAVTTAKINNGAVTRTKLGDRSVRSEALGRLFVRRDDQPVAAGTGGTAVAACGANERLISGGTDAESVPNDGTWTITRSGQVGNAWEAAAFNGGSDEGTLVVRAICLQAG